MGLLNKNGLTEEEFLLNYNPDRYKKPAVTVDALIFTIGDEEPKDLRRLAQKKLKLLMVKRGDHPFIGQWALPGGFVEINESIDDAAKRELFEETGIDADREDIYMEQLYTWGNVGRDPRMRIISVSYISLFNSEKVKVCAGDDAKDACWFEVQSNIVSENTAPLSAGYKIDRKIELKLVNGNEEYRPLIRIVREIEWGKKKLHQEILDSGGIAFDHSLIIEYALERLRNKITYTDIAFNLMPEYFTLTQLQQVYEVILGRKLSKANFRRKIDGMVIDTGKVRDEVAHRPAKLYMFNTQWDKSIFD